MYSWDPHSSEKPRNSPPSTPLPVIDPALDSPADVSDSRLAPEKSEKSDDATPHAPPKHYNPIHLTDDRPFPSSYDSDKKEQYSGFSAYLSQHSDKSSGLSSNRSMPHRVDPYPVNHMSSSHRRHYDLPHRRASPPPTIATIGSPSPSVSSLDRSSVSTPPIRRSPPHLHSAPVHYYHDPSMMQNGQNGRQHHFTNNRDSIPPPYMYSHPTYDHRRYEPTEDQNHSSYHVHPGMQPHLPMPNMPPVNGMREPYGLPYPIPGHQSVPIQYTEDAATKLSDRVRRRCFNCCTTDTSTWRRSNLSPGKVLCNKCGLFERTHSRPRPDQFPHKRGPLASSTLRSRSPPPPQLPPISPPYQYTHPSLTPLSSAPADMKRPPSSNTLPNIQSWHTEPGAQTMSAPLPSRRNSEPLDGRQSTTPPKSAARSQQATPLQEPRELGSTELTA